MRIWITTLLLCCSLPVWPQSDSLGRLFFTPQQRAALDHQRQQGINSNSNFDQQTSYTLNGEVRRSSGRNTRWVNGEAQTGSATPRGIIGDTYYPASGERENLLGSGRIIIRQAPSKP